MLPTILNQRHPPRVAQPRVVGAQVAQFHCLGHFAEERDDNHFMQRVARNIGLIFQRTEFGHNDQVLVDQVNILFIAVVRANFVGFQLLPHESADVGVGLLLLGDAVIPTEACVIGDNDVGDSFITEGYVEHFVSTPSFHHFIFHDCQPLSCVCLFIRQKEDRAPIIMGLFLVRCS